MRDACVHRWRCSSKWKIYILWYAYLFYVLLKHKHNNINNINDYNNFKKIQIVHRKAIINENKKIFQANCVDIYI